jgi:hypothetical protein
MRMPTSTTSASLKFWKKFGAEDSRVADCMMDRATVLRKMNQAAEADALEAKAKGILTKRVKP